MEKKDIIIDNFKIGSWDEDFNSEEAILCFEILVGRPCKDLVDKYKIKSEMEYLHFILPHVAKLFKIDRKKLVEQWVDSVGIYKCLGVIK